MGFMSAERLELSTNGIVATDQDTCNFFGLAEHMLNRGKETYTAPWLA